MKRWFFSFVMIGSLLAYGQSPLSLEEAFPNLTFNQPVDLQHAPDGSHRLFVVEKRGMIWVFENNSGVLNKTVFLDIRDRVNDSGFEEGLLGLAFHPAYATNGHFFVYYSAANPRRSVISRFKVSSADSNVAVADSELVILEVNQPFSNHNGGQIAFGPDGMFYIALGDGGSGGDPFGHGQNLATLLGSILRVDVNQTQPGFNYSIPPDNPFAGNTEGYREEIFAYGLRNPWRFSFDTVTGMLWCGDVGQNAWEEIDMITSGGNYGWNIMEGNHCFQPPAGCNTTGLILPVWEYPHSSGNISITGGYVYRGNSVTELIGKYIYADYGSGRIWSLDVSDINNPINTLLVDANFNISSFGIDHTGELFICGLNGKIYRFTPTANGVLEPEERAVKDFELGQNFPNPFNPTTTIPFQSRLPGQVRIEVFNLRGEWITTLLNDSVAPGHHFVNWDGRDARGQEVSSGIYFYQLRAPQRPGATPLSITRKMMLLK